MNRARRVEVAAAVLQRPDGSFLLAQRPPGKAYAGYWEFPGGKIEPNESAASGLARELHEELGIDATKVYPWLTRDYDYEHARVRLRFFRVTHWTGELHGRENQAFAWQHADAITVSPLLPANAPILRALALPTFYGVTHAAVLGTEAFLRRLDAALNAGLQLVQVREKSLTEAALVDFTAEVVRAARAHGARVLVNGLPEIAERAGADGVHLSAAALAKLTRRPGCDLVGASCHDRRELDAAARLGVDFVAVGPVKPTASHVQAKPLGWQRFRDLIADYTLPVYAIGGVGRADLRDAWTAGAHGVAAIRAAWS